MQKTLRRAPGSADLRAALAALYWSQVYFFPALMTPVMTAWGGCSIAWQCSRLWKAHAHVRPGGAGWLCVGASGTDHASGVVQGKEGAAEAEWNYACDRISAGCSRYQDRDWLSRIRRWPPKMVAHMGNFLALASMKEGRET